MTGESAAEQLGQTGKIDVGQTAEAAGVGLGMMLSGGMKPGDKSGQRQRVNPETWFETSKQGGEIYKALDEGRITPEMKDLTKMFYTSDLLRGGTALNDTTMVVVDKLNLLRKGVDDWIVREQGINVDPDKEYKILGKTRASLAEDGTYRTAIELFQGADADTLVEEWMHREYDRVPRSERNAIIRAYDAYKAALPEGVPVGCVDAYFHFLERPALTAACDVLLPNCYPFWEGAHIDVAAQYLRRMHGLVKAAGGDKPVLVTETGWPGQGQAVGAAVPSADNAMRYFIDVQQWGRGEGVKVFYFASFDEPWKLGSEGEVGTQWGLWDKDERAKYTSPAA